MTEEQLAINTIKQASIGELGQFSLRVSGREPLICEELFRHLPGKRLTFKAKYNDSYLLVKLFFRKKDYLRENRGLDLLLENDIPSPKKVWSLIDGEAQLVTTEFFHDSESLASRYKNGKCEDSICQTLTLLGRMHQAGLVQEDIHLDNFLFSKDEVKVLDGASIKLYKNVKSSTIIDNLALFFAQFSPQLDEAIPSLMPSYGGVGVDLAKLRKRIIQRRLWRVRKYQHKSLRSCTEFLASSNQHRFTVMRRDHDCKELRDLLEQLDLNIAQGVVLKNGHTSTVVQVKGSEDTSWVVKRYNIKNWRHGLGRSLRPSRAWISWKNGQALSLLGVPTPKPIALQENRKGRLRKEAYLVTEYISGDSLEHWLLKRPGHEAPPWLERSILNIFGTFLSSHISHGDMKSSNFIVHEETLMVIDLDGMHVHRDEKAFRHAFRKDIRRFLANWQGNTLRQFSKLLEPVAKQVGLDIQIPGGSE